MNVNPAVKDLFLSTVGAKIGLKEGAAEHDKLGAWLESHWEGLVKAGHELLTPPFTVHEVFNLAEVAMMAAQSLKGIFSGADRAVIAQTVLKTVLNYVLPAQVAAFLFPVLEATGVHDLIEKAFQAVFGKPPVQEAPGVVDDSTLPAPTVFKDRQLTGTIPGAEGYQGMHSSVVGTSDDEGGVQ